MHHLRSVAVAAVLLCVASPSRAQSAGCAPPGDTYAAAVLSGAKWLATDSSSTARVWQGVAKVPQTTAPSITLVTSDSICAVAAAAFATLSGPDTPVASVWVIAVGPTRYLVFDQRRRSAGKRIGAIFDQGMNWLADVAL
jgi:hypothetical protein